jgi:beta-galactosidase
VTRHAVGAGHGWYVAAGLDPAGVAWVIRRVLDQHGLSGPDPPGLESAVRVKADGTRLRFLLNHSGEPVEVTAGAGGVELLSGDRIGPGQRLTVGPNEVAVIREDRQ